jgi:hypothetical protein
MAGAFALLLITAFMGCGSREPAKPKAIAHDPIARKDADHASIGHSHIAPHGGQVQAVGDHHFELTYDGDSGRFTLFVLGADETKAEPIGEQEMTLQVRNETSGQFTTVKLLAAPQEDDPEGKASRFAATAEQLAGLGNFDAVARVPVVGDMHRVSFQFIGGKPISAGMANLAIDGFACPMACEKDRVYQQPGKCPVCRMKLEEHKAGVTAHADHTPKHGGVFFMAPDNWHHLEGTLVSERELRIYLYDNFTQPISAAGYSGDLKLQPVDADDMELGEPVTLPITPAEGNPYLVAQLPESARLPFQSEAWLQFPKAKYRPTVKRDQITRRVEWEPEASGL